MSKTAADTLRDNLTLLLQAQEISEAELARRTRVPQTTLNRIFRSTLGGTPRLDTLDKLARGLKTSPAHLLTPAGGDSIHAPDDTPRAIARLVGRLTEDFLLSSEAGRKEILILASEWAERSV